MVITSASLIAIYIVALVLVLKWPTRQRHPEDGQAIGCLMLVIVCLLGLGLALAIATWQQWRLLQTSIFYATVLPAVLAIPQLAWAGIKKVKSNSLAKGIRLEGEELRSRINDQTHVFRYQNQEQRIVQELRYYAPDGRAIEFEREADSIKPMPGNITWSIEDNLLVTLNEIQPGNRIPYVIRITPQGQIAYHIHAPRSRANGVLSRRTIEIRAGKPV